MAKLKKAGTVIISIILWAVILLAALFAFTTLATRDSNHVASLAGYTPMSVQTDSMAPTFNAGDLIIIKATDTSKLEVGDIICFHTIIMNEYVLNTHRISEISQEGTVRRYTTMGDNNNGIADQHVIADGDIVGKYVGKVSNLGKVMDFLSSSVGFLVVIVLPLLIFFIYQVYHLIMVSISLKRAVAVEAAQAQAEAAGVDAGALAEAEKAKAEAAAALEEARRLKAEAEALRAQAQSSAAQTAENVEEAAEAVEDAAEDAAEEVEQTAEETVEAVPEDKAGDE